MFDYGQVGRDGKNLLAHRVAYELHHGQSIPRGQCVLHRCDNPPCCNPKHLFLGTRRDNLVDMYSKRRRQYDGYAKGAKHGNAKLTDDNVREMRALYAAKQATQWDLAHRFGLTQSTVWAILVRRTWRHVE